MNFCVGFATRNPQGASQKSRSVLQQEATQLTRHVAALVARVPFSWPRCSETCPADGTKRPLLPRTPTSGRNRSNRDACNFSAGRSCCPPSRSEAQRGAVGSLREPTLRGQRPPREPPPDPSAPPVPSCRRGAAGHSSCGRSTQSSKRRHAVLQAAAARLRPRSQRRTYRDAPFGPSVTPGRFARCSRRSPGESGGCTEQPRRHQEQSGEGSGTAPHSAPPARRAPGGLRGCAIVARGGAAAGGGTHRAVGRGRGRISGRRRAGRRRGLQGLPAGSRVSVTERSSAQKAKRRRQARCSDVPGSISSFAPPRRREVRAASRRSRRRCGGREGAAPRCARRLCSAG